MSLIRVVCLDQTLAFDSTPVVASGGLEENFVQFSFCSQWDGFEKTAVFWRTPDEAYHALLNIDNCCQLPPEVTAAEGLVYFGVYGVDKAGRQRTSEVLTYRIVRGAITTGTKPSDPTPDIYTQLLAQYSDMAAAYRSKLSFFIGSSQPSAAGPLLWFKTSDEQTLEEVMLNLNIDETGSEVLTVIDEEQYGITNATLNTTPTEAGIYDFNTEETD